jgi:hypothetical protein
MKGIEYIIDDEGKKKAVVIDLKLHEDLWEDVLDQIVAEERSSEPRETLEEVKRSISRYGD